MSKYLVVIDAQNDFVSGVLGSPEAQEAVPCIVDKVKNFPGIVIFTRDTHDENYLESQEGEMLPVVHCVKETNGWNIIPDLFSSAEESLIIDKPSFGSIELADYLKEQNKIDPIESIELVGFCTDICVISNSLILKAAFPDIPIWVDPGGCAGVSPESHKAALDVMKKSQVRIVGD